MRDSTFAEESSLIRSSLAMLLDTAPELDPDEADYDQRLERRNRRLRACSGIVPQYRRSGKRRKFSKKGNRHGSLSAKL
jgi:hypothetical protein